MLWVLPGIGTAVTTKVGRDLNCDARTTIFYPRNPAQHAESDGGFYLSKQFVPNDYEVGSPSLQSTLKHYLMITSEPMRVRVLINMNLGIGDIVAVYNKDLAQSQSETGTDDPNLDTVCQEWNLSCLIRCTLVYFHQALLHSAYKCAVG